MPQKIGQSFCLLEKPLSQATSWSQAATYFFVAVTPPNATTATSTNTKRNTKKYFKSIFLPACGFASYFGRWTLSTCAFYFTVQAFANQTVFNFVFDSQSLVLKTPATTVEKRRAEKLGRVLFIGRAPEPSHGLVSGGNLFFRGGEAPSIATTATSTNTKRNPKKYFKSTFAPACGFAFSFWG